ncbi:MAG TPA: hypothetical protein DDZ99_03205 [Clostridiales bacterium]|nr:hypothetical protein [Clostridiales bacterium]
MQFSSLIGADDGNIEYFEEFITDEGNPENVYIAKQIENDIYKALNKLPKSECLPIILKYYSNYSSKDISKILGITKRAVDYRIKSGFEKLQDILSNYKLYVE